ncbi:MAG: sugar ABC transporter permease, partial [Hyphomicrobiales bacterium]|nr:sugar ABC transporter permease [Hyphomicrobiales bacterium]
WMIAVIAILAIVISMLMRRRRRAEFGFSLRPLWAEMLVIGLAAASVIAVTLIVNAYPLPPGIARRIVEAQGQVWPQGGVFIAHGFAVPVLIAVLVGVVMSFVATRMRFGRYVFSIGGNPEAASLSGIKTRAVTMQVFGLMGLLTGLAACITTARLNAATNSAGTLDELYVIAAAVIGGTSLAGGVGTIVGAMLGALIMQSLQSGMVLLGVDTPLQNIVVGIVLVMAIWLDGLYRRRIR